MLEKFFDSHLRVHALCQGPAGAEFQGFAQVLGQAGYAEITARRHLRAAEHFVHWADDTGSPVRGLTKQTLERFRRHLGRCRCPHFGHAHRKSLMRGARVFLTHLQEAGVAPSPVGEMACRAPSLFIAFCKWMRDQRGTCESTLTAYGSHIIELLARVGEKPETLDARRLRQFVIEGTCRFA